MLRFFFRLLLIAYAVLPLIAVVLLLNSVRTVQSQLAPVYETASERISDASDDLRDELRDLRAGFQPMVNSVNSLRSALSTVNSFINNSVNGVIDWVADTTFDVVRFPRFNGISLPAVVNLSFIDDISDHVDAIGDEVGSVIDTTGAAVTAQLDALTWALLILAAWVVLGPVLMLILVLSGALRV